MREQEDKVGNQIVKRRKQTKKQNASPSFSRRKQKLSSEPQEPLLLLLLPILPVLRLLPLLFPTRARSIRPSSTTATARRVRMTSRPSQELRTVSVRRRWRGSSRLRRRWRRDDGGPVAFVESDLVAFSRSFGRTNGSEREGRVERVDVGWVGSDT